MSDWAKLKVVDLKAELKSRDLPQHGLKAELVARLEESDAAPAETAEEEEASVEQEAEQQAEAPTEAQPDEAAAEAAPVPEAVAEPEEAAPEAEPAPAEADVASAQPEEAETKAEPIPRAASTEGVLAAEDTKPTEELPVAAPEPAPAQTAPAPLPTLQTESTTMTDVSDSQKRKRRSASPPIEEEEIARKKARAAAEGDAAATAAAQPAGTNSANDGIANDGIANAVPDVQPAAHQPLSDTITPAAQVAAAPLPPPAATEMDIDHDADNDRSVAPAQHPATSALYISNLMRPLRPADVQAHIASIAAGPDQVISDDVISTFFLDQIRTHAFVVLSSANAASRVRSALHDRVWPNESNRKPLTVDFVPAEKVPAWIEMEESRSSGGGRSSTRWEVLYDTDRDGNVNAIHQHATTTSNSFSGPSGPRGGDRERERDRDRDREHNRDRDRGFGAPPSFPGANAGIPTGPRGGPPPSGPRGFDDRGPPAPPRNAGDLSPTTQQTRARPSVAYQLTSSELARRRLDNMRSFYTRDLDRSLGREINRYSFESGDAFVDRGKEIFEGIRPPHRERRGGGKFGGRGRGGGGRGRGGRGDGGFRGRSDRYLPGFSGGGGGGGGFGGGGGRRFDDEDRRDRDMDRDRRF